MRMKKRWRASMEAVKMEIREHKGPFAVYLLLRTLVILTMILQLFNRNYENVFLCLLTLFLLACGVCTAVILWQAKNVLDTILTQTPFQMTNARCLHRAAVCCWIISGAALVRLVLWLWADGTPAPLFTYTALFIPAFFMAGLLFQVMSALFRQASELKEDQDLTI